MCKVAPQCCPVLVNVLSYIPPLKTITIKTQQK